MTPRTLPEAARVCFTPLISALHAVSSFAEELVAMAGRWNDRRLASRALRRLGRDRMRDIGLETADLDEVARRLQR